MGTQNGHIVPLLESTSLRERKRKVINKLDYEKGKAEVDSEMKRAGLYLAEILNDAITSSLTSMRTILIPS